MKEWGRERATEREREREIEGGKLCSNRVLAWEGGVRDEVRVECVYLWLSE